MIRVEIPLKLPSLNEYVDKCRYNKYAGNHYKQKIQRDIFPYIKDIPRFRKPVKIDFRWYEGDKRRDLDNICFSKKFILDALVKYGKLKNDNRKNVCGFSDSFYYGDKWKVILEIKEIIDDNNEFEKVQSN